MIGPIGYTAAEEPTARAIKFHGYSQAIELKLGKTRAVLCPQAGGRVLEFSVGGTDAMYFDEAEKNWQPGKPAPSSAGRFDYGPELTVTSCTCGPGEWTAEITKTNSVKLTSLRARRTPGSNWCASSDSSNTTPSSGWSCKQTMTNISKEPREVCHWGRSFSPGGGICLIPLGKQTGRFPSKYAMYEDSAVINVKATDERIRERDGFLEILAPPRKPKLGFDTYAEVAFPRTSCPTTRCS